MVKFCYGAGEPLGSLPSQVGVFRSPGPGARVLALGAAAGHGPRLRLRPGPHVRTAGMLLELAPDALSKRTGTP